MTVFDSTPAWIVIEGDGRRTYDLPWEIDYTGDVEVWKEWSSGSRLRLSYGTDYGIDFLHQPGMVKRITFSEPLLVGERAYVALRPTGDQALDLHEGAPFRAGDVEHALDRLTWHVRSLREQIERTPLLDPFETGSRGLMLLKGDDGDLLRWGGGGTRIEPAPPRDYYGSEGPRVSLGVDVRDYGADPNGSYDSVAAIQAALAEGHRTLYFPPGRYRLASEVTLPPGTRILGAGPFATEFVAEGDHAFYARPDFDQTAGYAPDWNDCTFQDFRIRMTRGGIRGIGHRTRIFRVQFAGGDPGYWCIDLRSANEFTILDVEGGWSGGDLRLYANGIRVWGADTSLADLRANDAAGVDPPSSFGGGIGERDINFGDGYIARVRLRIYAQAAGMSGLWLGHMSTKMPSQGDTSPNAVAGVLNNVVVENCQMVFEASGHEQQATAYHFRRIQRCTFVCLNPERSGRPYVIEGDGLNELSAEASKHNVFVGCQALNTSTGQIGIERIGAVAMPTILGGQAMAPWGGLPGLMVTIGDDSGNAELNASPRDTFLSGQLWLGPTHTQEPDVALRVPGGRVEVIASAQLAGDGTSTDIVIDLPRPTSGLLSSNVQVADNPDFWPRLTEGTDYGWTLERVNARWDRVRITLSTPPATGTTIHARVVVNLGSQRLQIVPLARDDGARSDGWASYWSSHPKNPLPSHGISFYVAELNAAYLHRTVGVMGRSDARLVIGNGPDLGSQTGGNGPLSRIEFQDPIRLLPWPYIPDGYHRGRVFMPQDRATFGDFWQYWQGGDRPYVQVDVAADGAPTGWDWVPLGWSPLERVAPISASREITRTDLGRILILEAATDVTLTVRGDLLREDEAGVDWVDAQGRHMRVAGWFELWNMAPGAYTLSVAAGAGVTLAGNTAPLAQHERRKALVKRTGSQQLTVYLA